MITTDFYEESRQIRNGYDLIVGIDEVGRGSFAGPVVAAGVIFDPICVPLDMGITDSKLLSPFKRKKLSDFILIKAFYYHIAFSSVETINKIGILKATEHAFQTIIHSISEQVRNKKLFALIDGNKSSKNQKHPIPQKRIIKGDQKSISIAAASIIAKVYRDNLMYDLHDTYPNYSFRNNKGYGTLEHRDAIKKFGLSKIHRTSFNLSKFL